MHMVGHSYHDKAFKQVTKYKIAHTYITTEALTTYAQNLGFNLLLITGILVQFPIIVSVSVFLVNNCWVLCHQKEHFESYKNN